MASLLDYIPAFEDLCIDDAQVCAFKEARGRLAASGSACADDLFLGCVARLDRGFPLVVTKDDVFRAEHSVGFAKKNRTSKASAPAMLPAIGDIVVVRKDAMHDMGVIEEILPRRTAFERWRGKNRGDRQTLAANIDVIFIVQPLGADRDTSALICDRIARSLVLARDCGANPVVVFTKTDRCSQETIEAITGDIQRLAGSDVPIIATSSHAGQGLKEVLACIPHGKSAMILGESGAGKSSLLNALIGVDVLDTNEVRPKDDAGRHTTVSRIMIALPGHGLIADCPGLRSLPLVGHERGLALCFPEIVDAAQSCRFNDCTHMHEPGCAVRAGIDSGDIDPIRLDAFLSLAQEMRVSAQSLDPDIHL